DSLLLRVHTLGSDEGSMTLQELTILCTTLSKKVESLEANLKQTKKVYGAAYTKLIKKVKKLEKTIMSNQARRRRAVSTGSGGISTASRLFNTAKESVSTVGASMPVSTAGMVQEVNISIPSPFVIKDKEELDEEERQRMDRVHEAAQSFTEEEWENIRARVEANEELSRRLQSKYSFDELKELFETTMKNVNTFVPMETKDRGRSSELAAGNSQATIIDSAKVGSSNRAAEAELDHEGSKSQKTNEASGSVQEQPEKEEKELSQEDLQQMMMVVLVEEVYVEAL
ncbi:hypothetical protein Tco_1479833, partial [Tanacetum coccineum]